MSCRDYATTRVIGAIYGPYSSLAGNKLRVFGPQYSGSAAAELRVTSPKNIGGESVLLSPAQVDDLIEQLCAIRGHASPVEVGPKVVPAKVEERPRAAYARGLGDSVQPDLMLWQDVKSKQLLGWWIPGGTSPGPKGETRYGRAVGWNADIPSPHLSDERRKHPAFLRALADVYERPTETVEVAPAKVTEGVEGVEGVSGKDFRTGGGAK